MARLSGAGIEISARGSRRTSQHHYARPDYLLSRTKPTDLKNNRPPSSYIVGDFKLTIVGMHRDWIRTKTGRRAKANQLDAMVNHAKKYQFAPVSVRFALLDRLPGSKRRGNSLKLRQEIVREFAEEGVFGYVIKLF